MFCSAAAPRAVKFYPNKISRLLFLRGVSFLDKKMLPRANRLLKKKDFDNVWQSGRSAFGRLLGVKAIKNNLSVNRFGIMVGLKVSKKAVERNLVKRRLREIIRVLSPAPVVGFDIAITVLPAAREAGFAELRAEMERCLKKLNIEFGI